MIENQLEINQNIKSDFYLFSSPIIKKYSYALFIAKFLINPSFSQLFTCSAVDPHETIGQLNGRFQFRVHRHSADG